MEKITVVLFTAISLRFSILVAGQEDDGLPRVNYVNPHSGSLAGGMKFTVFGQNFATDQYSVGVGNENNGNTVIFTNGISDIGCDVFREDTTQNQIVCYTVSGMELDVPYYVRVKVNNIDIPDERLCNNQPNGDDCSFMGRWWNTPVIRNIEPHTGMPGNDLLVNISGRIVTTRFGSDQDISANGREEKLLRLYGPGSCPLKDEDYEFFGIYVDENSFDGYMVCKPNETFVGNANFSFMIEPPFGRSWPQSNLLRVSATGEIYMFQYYTDVTSVSPSALGTEGGGTLRVYGHYFEQGGTLTSTYDPIRVEVGGTECVVTNVVKDEYLDCTVAKMPTQLPSQFPGGRGVNVESWTDGNFASIDALKDAPDTSDIKHFDMTQFCGDEINGKQTRMKGIFIPSKSGFYAFQVKATYKAKIYVDGVAQAESTGTWQSGAQMELTKNQRYLVMVVAMGPSANPGISWDQACVEARAIFFSEEKFTSAWTGFAFQEEHIIRISSTSTQDVQNLQFSGFTEQASVSEVQKVCVEGGSFYIRLGMYGAWTEKVGVDVASDVETALNALPFLDDTESFSVAQDGDQCVLITFNSQRGNFPSFDVVGDDITSFTVTNPGSANGVPDNNFVSLMMGGRPSKPFNVSGLDSTKLQAAVDSMFETTCPRQFYSDGSLFQSFEEDPSLYLHGEVVNDIEPFCGKKSVKNPKKIFPWKGTDTDFSLKMMLDFYACFAYSGLNNTKFVFKYRDIDGIIRWSEISVNPLEEQTSGNIWSYACVHPFPITGKGDLIEAQLKGDNVEEFFVDAVVFGEKPTFTEAGPIHSLRLKPASPNPSMPVLIDHSEVTYDAATDKYAVRLFPLDCGYNFGLFELMNKQGVSPTGDTGSTVLSGGSTSLGVTRTDWASPPVQGTFTVTFQGQESGVIHANMTTEQMRNVLQGIPDIGVLSVELSEDSTCANADAHVTFLTRAGDQSLMQISQKSMTAPPSGDVEIVGYRDGHLQYYPIPGDLIFIVDDMPQVVPYINNIPCHCSGDCSFQWSAALTPSITSLNIVEGWVDETLEITGDKFSTTPEDNTVTIGNTPCTVTASTTTTITCTVGSGSGMNQPVTVVVAGKGKASGTATFSYVWTLGGFEPVQGSFGGGQILTVNGNGLPLDAQVYISDIQCEVIDRTPTHLLVKTPKAASPPASDAEVSLEVRVPATGTRRRRQTYAGQTTQTASTTYTYSVSLTGIIQLVGKPAVLSVKGGDTVTVTGTNFGSANELILGDQLISDLTRTESGGQTTIVFQTPQLQPGEVEFCLNVDNNGCALDETSNTIPVWQVALSVTDVSPNHGSLLGGTVLTITGAGFGTVADDVEVMVGSHKCSIQQVTSTELICQIDSTAKEVIVTNKGTGSGFDMYYAFDKEIVTVNVGDIIQWQWDTAEYVKTSKHGIYQTDSESSTELIPNGINSGVATRSGMYRHQFTLKGTYHIWSGQVTDFRSYRGKVIVVDKQSSAEQITVKVAGQEAIYDNSGLTPLRRKRGTVPDPACSITSAISTCTDPDLQDLTSFYFIFSTCYTPTVSEIIFTPASGEPGYNRTITTSSKIRVRGTGFSTEACTMDVTFGDGDNTCSGSALSSPVPTTTEFVFQPNVDCTLPAVGIQKEVSVIVKNRGYALMKMERYYRQFAFLPSITAITPNSGSEAGYTAVVIEGTGLQDIDTVLFNLVPAVSFDIVDDTSINCVSPKSTRGPVTVAKGNAFPGVCDITSTDKCDFLYPATNTPKILNVEPATIDSVAAVTVTLTGEKFGTIAGNVQVSVGGEECGITSVTDNTIECSIEGLPAGYNNIDVIVNGMGKASTTKIITGVEGIEAISPATGSKYGGTSLTLTGHGFHREGTTVSIDDIPCELTGDATISEIICEVPPHEVGPVKVQVAVNSDSMNFPEMDFEYTALLNGVDVNPKSGVAGEIVTISGSYFGADYSLISVDFDGAECVVQAAGFSDSSFTCELDGDCSGDVVGYVVKTGYGKSNTFDFSCTAQLDTISPASGDAKGNQKLTVQGKGLSADMEVTVCGNVCLLDDSNTQTATELVCITPPGTDGDVCDVSINTGATLTDAYTYTAGSSPVVTDIDPRRGGTGGGTIIAITGEGFGTDASAVRVTLNGNECEIDVDSFSDTNIQCAVPAHTGTNAKPDVVVEIGSVRAVGDYDGALGFWYIDRFSSPATWGGSPPPGEGELVVISKGHIILLDQNTEILTQVLISGGQLIFDCDQPSVELKAKYILIANGGKLQIGTEDEPCLNKAIITMYGHQRAPHLPVYGSKVLAVREGVVELHGKPISQTWTRLSETSEAGSSTILLPKDHVADWAVNDEIVIATTGDRLSQEQSEQRTILSKTDIGDNTQLTLDEPLAYTHTGMEETYTGPGNVPVTVHFRAEVGLLTRTVLFRGNEDSEEWKDPIEACAAEFQTGQHATQTCFQGRFGEETGSDRFGGHLMIHNPMMDSQLAQAHIEYTEFRTVGQAFQLGRYPVHFHINGNMSLSYVHGCAIHKSFNRAVNVHWTHYTTVTNNVVFDINGGAYFLEDGIENGNIFEYNLGIFVKSTDSLQNDDLNAATYWVTNPLNIFRHNAAAGGTHNGAWLRMHEHTDGPSYNESICPRRVPLGEFKNNTFHSSGEFGLWVFQEWQPQKDGRCHATVDNVELAVFEDLVVWNCRKGVETVDAGAILFKRLTSVGNSESSVEGIKQMNTPKRSEDSAGVKDSLLVGHPNAVELRQARHGVTNNAIVAPFGGGYRVENVKFLNFDEPDKSCFHWAIKGLCPLDCGGYALPVSGLEFENTDPKVFFRWENEAVIEDNDGTLTGNAGYKVTPYSTTLPPSCVKNTELKPESGEEVAVCPPDVKFYRLAFNNIYPSSLEGQSVAVTNEYGTSTGPFRKKRFTHRPGWMVNLVAGVTSTIGFVESGVNADSIEIQAISNVSFTAQFSEFTTSDDCVLIRIRAFEEPDQFSLNGGNDIIEKVTGVTALDCASANHGDWIYQDGYVTFAIKGPSTSPGEYEDDITVSLTFYKCYWVNCEPPLPPSEIPPELERPDYARTWDGENIWKPDGTDQVVSASTDGLGDSQFYPKENDDVTISAGDWIVLTKNMLGNTQSAVKRSTSQGGLRLGTLLLLGTLEISDLDSDFAEKDYNIDVNFIIIKSPGRLIIGWPDQPFLGTATITIHGTKDSPYFQNPDWHGATVGAKAIAVYGGLDLHGKDYGKVWITLKTSAAAGSQTIEVSDDVSGWEAGSEIIITTTSNRAADTERRTIQSISGSTIILTEALAHKHVGSSETANGQTYEFAAAVGLITRNIKIQGVEEESQMTYGPRILISIMQDSADGNVYQGFARVTNTEFRFMGQEGFTEEADPRPALAFLATDNTDKRPSVVSKNSFHDLYGTAVVSVGSSNLDILDNVIYKSVGTSINIRSNGATVKDNLASNLLWPGSYNGRYEDFNFVWDAAIDVWNVEGLTLEGNYVAGSQKAAYHISGNECDNVTEYDDTTSNVAVGNLVGFLIFPGDVIEPARDGCNSFSNMKFWKNEIGFYYNNLNSLKISNMVFADHRMAMFPMVVGPSSLNHICEHKTVKILDTVLFGHISSTDCGDDASTAELLLENYYKLSGKDNIDCLARVGPAGERLAGIVFGSFSEGSNKAPRKPCFGVQASTSICGSTLVEGVTFVNFGTHSSCKPSFAVSGNPDNDDGQHPMTIRNSQSIDVEAGFEAYFPRPNLRKVNPGDCVDLDCDAMKKLLVQDEDGSLLGSPGAYLPASSEFEWDGDKRRGIGDYRIPVPMQTDYLTGNRIPFSDLYDEKGIPRDKDNCVTFNKPTYTDSEGQYFYHKCPGMTYKMMAIESLDWDTLTRRLSPVVVRQAVAGKKYIDLINGPQDHGCCSGYNCNRRLSLFHALVAPVSDSSPAMSALTDGQVDIFLTSTTPDKIRFLFVDPDESSCVVISFYYTNPNRIDVYIESEDGSTTRKYPKNGKDVNGRFVLDYVPNEEFESIKPTCDDDVGSNFIHRDARLLYFVLKGKDKIQLVRHEQIIVSFFFPTMTPEEVFGEGIIENMAAMLNVPPNKVRIVKIVASTDGTRRKRSTGSLAQVEIGDEPSTTADASSGTDVTVLAGTVMTACQDNTIGAVLETDGTTCESVVVEEMTYVPVTPESLQFHQELTPQHEGAVFSVQPKLRAYDSLGNVIVHLGIKEDPWKMTATIRSGTGHPDGVLGGTTTVTSMDGWFNFTDLTVSHAGQGYIIDFDISKPTTAADLNLAVSSAEFDIEAVPMKAGLYAITSDDIVEGSEFSITLELRDKMTDQPLRDITWRGHTFDVDCGLPGYNEISTLTGNTTKTFDSSTGKAQFDGLALSGYGPIYLECHIISTPEEFDFYFYRKIFVLGASQVGIQRDTSDVIVVRFKEDFATTLPTDSDKAQLEQMVLQDIVKKNPDVIIIDSEISEGSILITFTVEGATVDVTAMTGDLCTSIAEGQSYTLGSKTLTLDAYMTVDGQDYYGMTCGAKDSEGEGLHPGYIALIAVCAVVIVAVVIGILLWKFKVMPKTKTHDNGKTLYLGRGITQEGTFTSLSGRSSTLYHSHVDVGLRASPIPVSAEKQPYPENNLLVAPSDTRASPMNASPLPNKPNWKY